MRAQTILLRLPRNPLLHMLVVAAGAVLLAGLIAMSLIVGTAVLAVAAIWLLARRWLGRRKHDQGDPTIIDGEFTVAPRRARDALPRTD
ncbi:MAG: hypothetical protein ACREPS_04465 [Rhodanobacteraceae bacterium]